MHGNLHADAFLVDAAGLPVPTPPPPAPTHHHHHHHQNKTTTPPPPLPAAARSQISPAGPRAPGRVPGRLRTELAGPAGPHPRAPRACLSAHRPRPRAQVMVDAEMAAGGGLPAADSASLNHRRDLHVHGRPNDAYSLGRHCPPPTTTLSHPQPGRASPSLPLDPVAH